MTPARRGRLDQKMYADAESLQLSGYKGMKQREKTIPPQGKDCLREALDRLIELSTATEKIDEAKKCGMTGIGGEGCFTRVLTRRSPFEPSGKGPRGNGSVTPRGVLTRESETFSPEPAYGDPKAGCSSRGPSASLETESFRPHR